MVMKKRLFAAILGIALVLSMTGCGNDEVKVISNGEAVKNTETAAAGEATAGEAAAGSNAGNSEEEAGATEGQDTAELKGYVFTADGVSFTVDMEMAPVLAVLGEPVSYFEAESCAFKGLDKIYTYSHYEVDTYPEGDKDMISTIILKDDLISTPEGLALGMTQADMETVYGTEYEMKGNMFVYTKDGMHLSVLVENGLITSIEYDSAVLDTAN